MFLSDPTFNEVVKIASIGMNKHCKSGAVARDLTTSLESTCPTGIFGRLIMLSGKKGDTVLDFLGALVSFNKMKILRNWIIHIDGRQSM